MRVAFKPLLVLVLAACPFSALHGQNLAPRAYVITPVHSNAVTLTYSFSYGALLFNNVRPITAATAILHVPIFSYYHSLNFFG